MAHALLHECHNALQCRLEQRAVCVLRQPAQGTVDEVHISGIGLHVSHEIQRSDSHITAWGSRHESNHVVLKSV